MARLVAHRAFDMYTFLTEGELAWFFEDADVITKTSSTLTLRDVYDGITEQLTLTGSFGGYQGDYPTTGTVTGASYSITGGPSFAFTSASIGVQNFTDYVLDDDIAGLFIDMLDGADEIIGSSSADVLYGFDGNDSLDGGAGNDDLFGGLGDDRYYVNGSFDEIYEEAGEGNDTIYTSLAAYGLPTDLSGYVENLVYTGSSSFTAVGNALNNFISGGAPSDSLNGGDGHDTLEGRGGNDNLNGGTGVDTASYASATAGVTVKLGVTGAQNTIGAGSDTLNSIERLAGSGHNDSLSGNTLADTLYGAAGNDSLSGGSGNDLLYGEAGADTLNGGAGDDRIDGGAGIDTISFGGATAGITVLLNNTAAQNTVGAGWDTLVAIERASGSNFNDTIVGSSFNNTLSGGLGNDYIHGASGNDYIYGNDGNDTLNGSFGVDTFYGGAGRDVFRFDAALVAANSDVITDFVVVDDAIQIDDDVFTAAGAVGTLSAAAFRSGTAAGDASDRVIYDSATGKLYYDADGNGAGAQVQFAQLTAGLALTNADFGIIG